MKYINPRAIRQPFARFSHAIEIPPDHRILICSGQPGVDALDRVASTIEEQAHQCFKNINLILADAAMSYANVVRINGYVASRVYMKGSLSVRDQYVDNPPPACTTMIVLGFERPDFLVEVEVIAAGRE
jgi:enamine deaminase RidA (YjgF/YER057c/UK114 family)